MQILFANQGKLNFCVRWESSAQLSQTDRTNIQNAIQVRCTILCASLCGD